MFSIPHRGLNRATRPVRTLHQGFGNGFDGRLEVDRQPPSQALRYLSPCQLPTKLLFQAFKLADSLVGWCVGSLDVHAGGLLVGAQVLHTGSLHTRSNNVRPHIGAHGPQVIRDDFGGSMVHDPRGGIRRCRLVRSTFDPRLKYVDNGVVVDVDVGVQ